MGREATHFWGVELHADIEREFSIRRGEIVGAPGRITNIIGGALIFGNNEWTVSKEKDSG